jgi:cytochrome c553
MSIMSKQRITTLALALSLTATTLVAAPAKKAAAPIPPAEYETRVQQAMADPKSLAAGKRAAFLCVYCHGEDGNSVQENIPNLAGQHPVYLLTQIEKFGDGRRNDAFMSGLIKSLRNEDRINMAVYYASMSAVPAKAAEPALVERGRKRYQATCVGCHGPNAAGNKAIARLAGQRASYLGQALASYRASTSSRNDPVMTLVARKLAAEDIPALAAYLSTLK